MTFLSPFLKCQQYRPTSQSSYLCLQYSTQDLFYLSFLTRSLKTSLTTFQAYARLQVHIQAEDLKLEVHMRENIWCLSFGAWVTLLSIIPFSNHSHLPAKFMISHLFQLTNTPWCAYPPFLKFIYLLYIQIYFILFLSCCEKNISEDGYTWLHELPPPSTVYTCSLFTIPTPAYIAIYCSDDNLSN